MCFGIVVGAGADIGYQMLFMDRSINELNWISIGLSAASGAVGLGWWGVYKSAGSSVYLAEKFGELTMKDLLFIQGMNTAVTKILKKEVIEKKAHDRKAKERQAESINKVSKRE